MCHTQGTGHWRHVLFPQKEGLPQKQREKEWGWLPAGPLSSFTSLWDPAFLPPQAWAEPCSLQTTEEE